MPTITPTLTPTITGTVPVAPTPTSAATPTPPVLQSAVYYYDGDNNLVKSVVNGVTTYYVGRIYEKQVEGETVTVRKYYTAGSTTIAMRVDGTLYTVLGDQFGSASVTLDAAGDVSGEMRYYPFGETRLAYGSMFTGQRMLTDLGIDHYGARFFITISFPKNSILCMSFNTPCR